jgi:hypothetical protein
MIDLHGLNTSILDNYCINCWNNTSVNSIFCYDSVKLPWLRWRKTYILVMHHTTSDNSSHSTLIAKSENMARTSNDFRELLLLFHWNFGNISLEEGPDYWYLTVIFNAYNYQINKVLVFKFYLIYFLSRNKQF